MPCACPSDSRGARFGIPAVRVPLGFLDRSSSLEACTVSRPRAATRSRSHHTDNKMMKAILIVAVLALLAQLTGQQPQRENRRRECLQACTVSQRMGWCSRTPTVYHGSLDTWAARSPAGFVIVVVDSSISSSSAAIGRFIEIRLQVNSEDCRTGRCSSEHAAPTCEERSGGLGCCGIASGRLPRGFIGCIKCLS
jgi:hypothetical protein